MTKTTARTGLMSVLDMTPDQITRAEWRGVCETLRQAQERFAEIGQGRQTWMDWAVALCAERGKEPEAATNE